MVREIKNRKREIRIANRRHEKALIGEYNTISDNLSSGKAKVFLIGGGLAISYWLVRSLVTKKTASKDSGKKLKGKDKSLIRKTDNEILNIIQERVALFLVDLAQDVISEAIKKLDK